jgi:hypothetical protein
MDVLALILTVAAMVMFLFAASGRELRRFNEIAVGFVTPRGGADLPVHLDHEYAHWPVSAGQLATGGG